VVLVGPSGSGKTTLLRIIAGLETASAGELYFDETLVNDVDVADRDIAMVFQNYGLYPHMSVYGNMAFGLRRRQLSKTEIDLRVHRTAAMLNIAPLLDRLPKQLSGGQRQRVALGRAIVRDPAVFLLDEPLSNLDAHLRVQMRAEILKVHRAVAATIVYVTHDQVEALTMGDRIVVMNEGRIHQVGTPDELYHRPVDRFVAAFIGTPAMGFLTCRIEAAGEALRLVSPSAEMTLSAEQAGILSRAGAGTVSVGIRPEALTLDPGDAGLPAAVRVEGVVEVVEVLGAEQYLHLDVGGEPLTAKVPRVQSVKVDQRVRLFADNRDLHLFDQHTGKAWF
jgi:multiple sugar transport system ATP-binding protein